MNLYLLDTDHISLHQRGYEAVGNNILKISSDQIAISIISAEEMLRGRLARVRRAKEPRERVQAYYWLSMTNDYLCGFNVLKFDPRAESYFQELLSKRIRIGVQDLKIASIALSKQAKLVTRNSRHFGQIASLEIVDWSI